ncbi:hypothetical protein [Amycolatopsis sp. NPDC054798]
MNNVEISLSDDAHLYFRQNFRYGAWDGEDCARDNDWSGFGFVLGSGGDPLPIPGDYLTGHQCAHLADVSNGQAAMRLMEEAAPGKAAEWNGLLAYDYGDSAACEAAERIGAALAGYPLLDDEDLSERESENAARVLVDSYDVPEDVAADVVSALSDDGQGLCTDCHGWDIDHVMSNLGYRECAECDKWLATTFDEPLHYDCAEYYAEDDCECISVMVDGYRHGNHTVTMSDVRETLRGCEHCYPIVHPYGKNVA